MGYSNNKIKGKWGLPEVVVWGRTIGKFGFWRVGESGKHKLADTPIHIFTLLYTLCNEKIKRTTSKKVGRTPSPAKKNG